MAEEAEAQAEAPEEAAPENGEGGEGKKIRGKKLIIIIVVAVLLLAGAGAGVYFSGILGGDEEHAEEGDGGDSGHGEAGKEEAGHEGKTGEDGKPIPGQPVFYTMPEFLVNLNTGGKQVSFLKMRVALELPSEKEVAIIEAQLPRIQDNFNTYLRELRAADLAGSAGIYRLREELMARINKTIYPAKINDILFNEILVQ